MEVVRDGNLISPVSPDLIILEQDKLIFSDPEHPRISNYISTTDDEKYLILYRTMGTSGTALYITIVNDGKHQHTGIL